MDVKRASTVTVAQLDAFDEVIDVRSPSEYALDHVTGALNCPVLDDEERARVGTMYKQISTFDAKKAGAALVSRNIARHIEERFRGRTPRRQIRETSRDERFSRQPFAHRSLVSRRASSTFSRNASGSIAG